MISHKHISKTVVLLIAVATCLCLLGAAFSGQISAYAASAGVSMNYETELFDTNEIMDINIIMDETDWDDMLQNAISEEYYQCDVVVNGETFYRTAIRPKGNTSLSSIANDPDTDRYSFKLEFDHYVVGQTCYGLDILILNNNYADATNMKEALIYDMYRYLGADASLYNYAKVSVNGEYWGVYLALEAVEDSFLMRNYGVQNGSLYKPDSMDFGNKGSGGGFGSDSNGANLNYTDDDPDSYTAIWDGEITDSGKADHKRVVSALKNISEGNDLESYMDIDNLLRYMAVHIFSVNEDSLSGSMAHNYYLYESGGKLNLIPWDYNLAFGGMGRSKNADSVINSAIDDAFSSTEFFDTLMENEEYHAKYYAYLQQLVTDYIDGGSFDSFYNRVRSQIDSLVESDPTAFYSYEEYTAAADTLYQTVKLRGESIEGQINGTIPSTESAQQNSDALVDASAINIETMGSMNTGNQGPGGMDMPEQKGENPPDGDFSGENFPDRDLPGRNEDTADRLDDSSDENRSGDMPDNDGGFPGGNGFPGDGKGDFVPAISQNSTSVPAYDNLILLGICLAIMTAALVFAALYHRRPRRQ